MKRINSVEPVGLEDSDEAVLHTHYGFIKSGSTLLDLILGGGWALGRISNIVGDNSTGKTLLAMEAASNFARKHPNGKIWYRDAEHAFDIEYAAALGMPIDRVKLARPRTVEDFYEDLKQKAEWLIKNDRKGIYILDSLDALSDRKELSRSIDEPTYGGNKPKQMSELFRRLVGSIEGAKMCLLIISQTRDKIGISFGRKTTRAGGKAMSFYASQIIYLTHLKILNKTVYGDKLAVGVLIKAKSDKNKIGKPFRDCEFPVRFDYGVDDLQSCVEWLKHRGLVKGIDNSMVKRVLTNPDSLDEEEYRNVLRKAKSLVTDYWTKRDEQVKPKRKKYT